MLHKKNIFDNNDQPSKGKILLSEPFMSDPNFKRSAILLCQHSAEGSFGFILNQQLEMCFADALPEFAYLNAPLYFGGPVEPNTLHYLHLLGNDLAGSEEITDGVFWGGSFEALKILMTQEKVQNNQIRFFLGYSGWDAQQMEEELKENSWIVTNAQCADIFNSHEDKLWGTILKEMGGDYKSIASYPENPKLN